MQPPARVVLITGASRGIGAEVARQLASPDTHVIVNYREKAKRANAVVDAIRGAGGNATALAADITDDVEVAAMMQYITAHFGRLDVLVLNASGGLETDADPGYAMRLNRDAQRRLALLAMPLMPAARGSCSSPATRPTSIHTRRCRRATGAWPPASAQAKPRFTQCVPSSITRAFT